MKKYIQTKGHIKLRGELMYAPVDARAAPKITGCFVKPKPNYSKKRTSDTPELF